MYSPWESVCCARLLGRETEALIAWEAQRGRGVIVLGLVQALVIVVILFAVLRLAPELFMT